MRRVIWATAFIPRYFAVGAMVAALVSLNLGALLLWFVIYRLAKACDERNMRDAARAKATTSPVQTRITEDPIRAMKLSFPAVIRGQMVFLSVFGNGYYGADDVARCWWHGFGVPRSTRHPGIKPPVVGCSCGYYAVPAEANRRRRRKWDHGFRRYVRSRGRNDVQSMARLDVELLGSVVVHEEGYRAYRQRVLVAYMPRWCYLCSRRAKGFFAPSFLIGPHEPAILRATCGCQMPVRYDLQDLSNMARTEVRWEEPRKPPLTREARGRRVGA